MARIEKVLIGSVVIAIFGMASSLITSDDTFWQLQSGRYMAETGGLIRADTFTLTADAPRLEHCWLHDLIYYAIYEFSGYDGISILKGFLVAATAVVLIMAARLNCSSILMVFLFTVPVFLLSHWSWLDRPQLWSFLSFALLLYLCERYRKKPDRALFFFLPVMVLWSNLHAGAILAFPVMAAYLAGEGADMIAGRSGLSRADYIRLWCFCVFLALASLITPYGDVHILSGLFKHVTKGGGFSSEAALQQLHNLDWKGYSYADLPVFVYVIGAAVLLGGLNWKRFSFSHLFLLSGLAFMGYKHMRHIVLFYFGFAAIIPQYAEIAVNRFENRVPVILSRATRWACGLMAAGMIVYLSNAIYTYKGFFDTGLQEWRFPVKAANFIQEHKLPAALFNGREWGGYLAWRLYPGYRVFWDGRDTSENMFTLGVQITNGEPAWREALARYNVNTLVLLPCDLYQGRRFGLLKRLEESPYYDPVFADDFSLIFVRKNAVDSTWLRNHRLPRSVIDDTILAAAYLLTEDSPQRYFAFFEMFRVYNSREEHDKAIAALRTYLTLTPVRDPTGEQVYQMYSEAMKKQQKHASGKAN